MLRWLPAQGSGVAVLWALPFTIIVATLQAQIVLSFEGSLTVLPTEPTTTLGAHVTAQDLDLQETILEFVDSGILTGKKGPRFQAPTKRVKPQRTPVSGPTLASPQELSIPNARPLTLAKEQAKEQVAVDSENASPFRKWIKPQASKNTDVDSDESVPQDARRSRPRAPKPLPRSTKKQSTAAVSDISPPSLAGEQAEPEAATDPEPSDYPAPSADDLLPTPQQRNLPPLTTSQLNLRKKIRNVLTHYYNRPLNTRDRSPWELMHAMLAFEAHSKVLQGGPKGEPITAVGWLCYNQACKRRTLMYVDDDDQLQVRVGPALQGHRGQLLAMLAQSRINENYPMLVEKHELKVQDLIDMEKRTCYPRTELTFKLIGLMHYLESDETWLNDQGMEWDFPRLISEELRQPVRGAACGGTHRLAGLTLAYKTREQRGEPVDGQYLKAKKFVTRYQQYAYRLQNRDGSFSTEWFRGPGDKDDIDRKLKTTGHILEWLLYAASEKELKHWKTTKAANYLANIMYRNRYKDWESGPLGHAIHALLVYDRLVFSPYDPPEQSDLAIKSPATVRTRRNR